MSRIFLNAPYRKSDTLNLIIMNKIKKTQKYTNHLNTIWQCGVHQGSIPVYFLFSVPFLCDLDRICRNRSEKCVLKEIQNGGKSIMNQRGVAYMRRCVMSQGIQGKGHFHFTSYGSRVTGQKVKRVTIAPP